MVNSKLEKLLVVLIWYVLLITFRFVLPISEPPSNIDKYVIIFLSFVTTVIIYYIYAYNRNKKILKKINFLLEINELDEAERFINKCLTKQKKSRSVYMYKLYVLAMCGHITEFEKSLSTCQQLNKYKKLLTLDFMKGLTSIINYFKTSTCISDYSNQQYWGEIINALSAQNDETHIPRLLSIYSRTKFGMIKSVFAFKLYLTYTESKNSEKAEHYFDIALKHAPSLEIVYYIETSRHNKTGDDSLS